LAKNFYNVLLRQIMTKNFDPVYVLILTKILSTNLDIPTVLRHWGALEHCELNPEWKSIIQKSLQIFTFPTFYFLRFLPEWKTIFSLKFLCSWLLMFEFFYQIVLDIVLYGWLLLKDFIIHLTYFNFPNSFKLYIFLGIFVNIILVLDSHKFYPCFKRSCSISFTLRTIVSLFKWPLIHKTSAYRILTSHFKVKWNQQNIPDFFYFFGVWKLLSERHLYFSGTLWESSDELSLIVWVGSDRV